MESGDHFDKKITRNVFRLRAGSNGIPKQMQFHATEIFGEQPSPAVLVDRLRAGRFVTGHARRLSSAPALAMRRGFAENIGSDDCHPRKHPKRVYLARGGDLFSERIA